MGCIIRFRTLSGQSRGLRAEEPMSIGGQVVKIHLTPNARLVHECVAVDAAGSFIIIGLD